MEIDEAMASIVSLALCLFGFIGLLTTVFRLLQKKLRLAKRTALSSIALLIGAFGCYQLSEALFHRRLVANATGLSFWPRVEFTYDSDREFLPGDGTSIRVFLIPEKLLPELTNAAALAAANLPGMSVDTNSEWRQVRWKQTPLAAEESGLNLWFLGVQDGSDPQESVLSKWMPNALKGNDCLFGYWFKASTGHITDVWFCLIDPATRRLLIISIET
jgi:hypothetical protein